MEATRQRGEEGADVAMTLLPRDEEAAVVRPESQNCAGENVVHVTAEEPCLEGDSQSSNSSSSKCRNDIVCLPLIALRECSAEWWRRVRGPVLCALKCGLLLLFIVYIVFAFRYEFGSEPSLRLLVCTIIGVVVLVVRHLSRWKRAKSACDKARACVQPFTRFYQRHSKWFSRFLTTVVCGAILAFLIFDVGLRRPTRLVSVLGVVVFVAFMFFFSHSPRQVPGNRFGNPSIIHGNTVIYYSYTIVNDGIAIKGKNNITDIIIAAIVADANKDIINNNNESTNNSKSLLLMTTQSPLKACWH